MAEFDLPFLDRVKLLMELNDTGLPIEPLGYTPDEMESMMVALNATILEAIEEGTPLLGKDYFQRFKEELAITKAKGLRRTESGWAYKT